MSGRYGGVAVGVVVADGVPIAVQWRNGLRLPSPHCFASSLSAALSMSIGSSISAVSDCVRLQRPIAVVFDQSIVVWNASISELLFVDSATPTPRATYWI